METLGAELGLDTRRGTLEELAEEGLIRADPDSGFEEFPRRAAAHRGGQHRGGRETHLFAPEIPLQPGGLLFL